ncbi:hypothetical protein CYG49_00030 [Candidatus Saccharibacteria bacterium]|nr:MAG: hypothetical protein CYG49_00030 [Candidatus Saccharibacteria bacterium]
MSNQDDNTTDDRFRNPQSPDPLTNSPQGSEINNDLGQKQSILEDQRIDPDPTLTTYQDDIATGEQEDRVQYEQGDQPADFLGIPEDELKREFDKISPTEQEYPGDENAEDYREHVEDMDEDDKERSTDDTYLGK